MDSTPVTPVLDNVDAIIILGFLVLVTAVGYFMSGTASEDVEEYFIGKNSIPWWVLGISTATSNFDMTGTMVIVAMVYDFGYRGFLVELRGGVGLSLAFLMVFLGKWLRRSRVMTSAQWMKIRFGTDKAGKTAHILSALAQCILSLGMIAYFCVGAGKFLEFFLPWDKNVCTAIMVAVGLFYTLMSGIYGVVFTDVIQMIILSFTAIFIAVKGFMVFDPKYVPASWSDLSLTMPKGQEMLQSLGKALDAPNIAEITFNVFGVCVLFYVFRVCLEGCSGVGGYTDQRFFAARNEREAGLLTLESILIAVLRWAFVGGLVALAYHLVASDAAIYKTAVQGINADSEKILPIIIQTLIPVGLKGFVIAGLIAAAMSTFDSTLNAGASYMVVDIYHSYMNPKASKDTLVWASWVATTALAVSGVLIASVLPNINDIWSFITMAIGPAMFIPLFLRWYWPRFNGYGFAIGTGVGMVVAITLKFTSSWPLYVTFPTILGASLVGCIIGSYATDPVDEEILLDFWVMVNPQGFWGKYAKLAVKEGRITRTQRFKRHIEQLNEIIATCLAVPFNLAVLLAALAFIFHDWQKFFTFGIIALFC
ncbi:sodium:solute symporter, partial [Candidatus Riflebacteria bacterium]